ncbi:hypothetical protein GYMLUDRAFT_34716 [Collybiopsis luxurians FD-317 M1]|nr:hypothetical protein GYMLUDRAFT_34716 [Collybiopsis luxurians FD-317 M1]
MVAAGASLIAYVIASLAILITYFIFFPPTSQSKYQYASTPAYLRPALSFLVLCHTFYILYEILLDPPTNLFTALNVPLTYPTDSIRSLLLMFSDDPASGLPAGIERVLTRLGSASMRILYVRFGHETIASCEYCSSWSDFALYALPGAVWEYSREVMMMGALTLRGTRHAEHRTLGVGALCAAAMFEAYVTLTTEINMPKDDNSLSGFWQRVERLYGGHGVVMWHDVLLLARRILFLVLPIVVHFVLKPSPPLLSLSALSSPTPAGQPTQVTPESMAFRTLQSLTTKIQLLRLTRGAIPRNPTLRAAAQKYWATERQEGEYIRGDGDVQRKARALQLGFDEATNSTTDEKGAENDGAADGPLLKHAKTAVQNLFAQGFVPSPFWPGKPPPSSVPPSGSQ